MTQKFTHNGGKSIARLSISVFLLYLWLRDKPGLCLYALNLLMFCTGFILSWHLQTNRESEQYA